MRFDSIETRLALTSRAIGRRRARKRQMLKKGYKALLEEAAKTVQSVPVQTARHWLDDESVAFVDLRDIRELKRTGRIPGAHHAPRGMLEFWVDPESPYHREIFASGKKLVFFCAAGWRSALAVKAVQEMGLENVVDLEGGFAAWTDAGAPVEAPEEPPKRS